MSFLSPAMTTILLLIGSNVFMTFAWYAHLKDKTTPLLVVILVSWGIALFEYCLLIPANRIGHNVFSLVQLKTIQEVITLIVFAGFAVLYMGEAIAWNHLVGFIFLCAAAFFMFYKF